ncbi:putative ATP-binding surface antigen [Neospora caninum Liverpool]|uniref:Putative ATP-binding surface antigen n=1 Tax=Neospora caninum (strain Liverpool) TaxID=572307 RepID=F0VBS6_NEOCL|nr:putative ATP-binding surface antigen [Neospora caninum Liverpool]CBZ51060.1 putative ATP-binding surface antigen [Neospora caninum Liverpool]|eukprot:XP_003881093.1 putative ATP-binding surface antigen [Neospora caninum Liverpool]
MSPSPSPSSRVNSPLSRLIPIPLVAAAPQSSAPVTLLQWRRSASSSNDMHGRFSKMQGPVPPASLVGFTSLGVGVTIIATYEILPHQQWSFEEKGVSSSKDPWHSDRHDAMNCRTAEIIVDVVDLHTVKPIQNARIEVLRGSLSFTTTENKDLTGGAHDGVSLLSSSGSHAGAEAGSANNSTCWFTNDRGFVRIPLPQTVHPFDPLYVVVTADMQTWQPPSVSTRERRIGSTAKKDCFPTPETETTPERRRRLGSVRSGEEICGNGSHELPSSGRSPSPSELSSQNSSNRYRNFRGNGSAERVSKIETRTNTTKALNSRHGNTKGLAFMGGPYFIPGNPGRQRLDVEDAARRRAELFFHESKMRQNDDITLSLRMSDDVSAKLAHFSYHRQQMEAALISDRLVYAPGETLILLGFISVTGADACRLQRDLKTRGEKANENEEKDITKAPPLCLPHWTLGLDFTASRNMEEQSGREGKEMGSSSNSSGRERATILADTSTNKHFFSNDLYVLLTFRWTDEDSRHPPRQPTSVIPRNQPSAHPSASLGITTIGRATGGGQEAALLVPRKVRSGENAPSARAVRLQSANGLARGHSKGNIPGAVPPLRADADRDSNVFYSSSSARQSTPGRVKAEEATVNSGKVDEDGIPHKGSTKAVSNVDPPCSEFLVPLNELGSFSLKLKIPRNATQRLLQTPAIRIVSPSVAMELIKDEDTQDWKHIRGHAVPSSFVTSNSRERENVSYLLRPFSAAAEAGDGQGDDPLAINEEEHTPPLFCTSDNFASSFHVETRTRADIIPVKVRSFSRPVIASPRIPSVQFLPRVLSVSPVVAPQGEAEARGTLQRIGVETTAGKESTKKTSPPSSLLSTSATVTLSLRIQRRNVRQGEGFPSSSQGPYPPLRPASGFNRPPSPKATPSFSPHATPGSQAPFDPPDNFAFDRFSPREATRFQPMEQDFYWGASVHVEARKQDPSKPQVSSTVDPTSSPQRRGTGRRDGNGGQTPEPGMKDDSTDFVETHSQVCTSGCRCLDNAEGDIEWSLVTLQHGATVSYTLEKQRERMGASREEVNRQYQNKGTEFVWGQGLRSCPEGAVRMRGEGGRVDIEGMENASNAILIQSCRAIPLRIDTAKNDKRNTTENRDRSCVMSTPVDSYPYLLVSELCVGEASSVENRILNVAEGDEEQGEGICNHKFTFSLSGSGRKKEEGGPDEAQPSEKNRVTCDKKANNRNVPGQEEQAKDVVPPRTGFREWGCYVDCVVLQATEKTLDTRKITLSVNTDKPDYDVGEEVILSFRNPFGPYSSIAPRRKREPHSFTLVEANSGSEPRQSSESDAVPQEKSETKKRNTESSTILSVCDGCTSKSLEKGLLRSIPPLETEQLFEAATERPVFTVNETLVTETGTNAAEPSEAVDGSVAEALEEVSSPLVSVSHSWNTGMHDNPSDGTLFSSVASPQLGSPVNRPPSSNTRTIQGSNWSARLNISWLTKSASILSRMVPLMENGKPAMRHNGETEEIGIVNREPEERGESGQPTLSRGVGSFTEGGLVGKRRIEVIDAAKAAQAAELITVSAGTVPVECRFTVTCKLRLVLQPPLSQERLPLAGLDLVSNPRFSAFTEAQTNDEKRGTKSENLDTLSAGSRYKDKSHSETNYSKPEAPFLSFVDEINDSKERRRNWLLPEFGPFFVDQEVYINVKSPSTSPLQLPPGVLAVKIARAGSDDSYTNRQRKEAQKGEKVHQERKESEADGANENMDQNSEPASQKKHGKHTTLVISASLDLSLLMKEEKPTATVDGAKSAVVSRNEVSAAIQPRGFFPRANGPQGAQHNTVASAHATFSQANCGMTNNTEIPRLPGQERGHPDVTTANEIPCGVSHGETEYSAIIYLVVTDQRLLRLRGPGNRTADETLFSPAKVFSRVRQRGVRSSLDVRTHTSSSSYHNLHDLASYRGLLLTSAALRSQLQFDPWIEYTNWPLHPSDYFDSDLSCSLRTCMRDKYSSSLVGGGFSGDRLYKRTRVPSSQMEYLENSDLWVNSARSRRQTAPENDSMAREQQADIGVRKQAAMSSASSHGEELYDEMTVSELDEKNFADILTSESRTPSVVRLYKVNMRELAVTGSMSSSSRKQVDSGEDETSLIKKASVKLSFQGPASGMYAVNAFAVIVKKERIPVAATVVPVLSPRGDAKNCTLGQTSDGTQEQNRSAVLLPQEVWYDSQQAFLEGDTLPAYDSFTHLSSRLPRFLRYGDVAYVDFGSDTIFCTDSPASVIECSGNCAKMDINKPGDAFPPPSNTTFLCWKSLHDSTLEVTQCSDLDFCGTSPLLPREQDQGKIFRSPLEPTKQHKNDEKGQLYTSTHRLSHDVSCSQGLRLRVKNNVAGAKQPGSVHEAVIAFSRLSEAGNCTWPSKKSKWEDTKVASENPSLETEEPGPLYNKGNFTTLVEMPVLPIEFPVSIRKFHLLFPHSEDASTGRVESAVNTSLPTLEAVGKKGSNHVGVSILRYSSQLQVHEETQDERLDQCSSLASIPCVNQLLTRDDDGVSEEAPTAHRRKQLPTRLEQDEEHTSGWRNKTTEKAVQQASHKADSSRNKEPPPSLSPPSSLFLVPHVPSTSWYPMEQERVVANNGTEPTGSPGPQMIHPEANTVDSGPAAWDDFLYVPEALDLDEGGLSIEAKMGYVDAIERRVWQMIDLHKKTLLCCEYFFPRLLVTSRKADAGGLDQFDRSQCSAENVSSNSSEDRVISCEDVHKPADGHGKQVVAPLHSNDGQQRHQRKCPLLAEAAAQDALEILPNSSVLLNIILADEILSSFDGQCNRGDDVESNATSSKTSAAPASSPQSFSAQTYEQASTSDSAASNSLHSGENSACGTSSTKTRAAISIAGKAAVHLLPLYLPTENIPEGFDDSSLPLYSSFQNFGLLQRPLKQYFTAKKETSTPMERPDLKDFTPKEPDLALLLHAAHVFRILKGKGEERPAIRSESTEREILRRAEKAVTQAINNYVKTRTNEWEKANTQNMLKDENNSLSTSLVDWIGVSLLTELRFALGAKHSFELPEKVEQLLGFENLVLKARENITWVNASEVDEWSQSHGTVLELPALLLAATPTVTVPNDRDMKVGSHYTTFVGDRAGQPWEGQRNMTHGFEENAVPRSPFTSTQRINPSSTQKHSAGYFSSSTDSLRERILEESLRRMVFSRQELYATVATTGRVGPFPNNILSLKSHALLLLLWCGEDSLWRAPHSRVLWYVANAVADSDYTGPLLDRGHHQMKWRRNSNSAEEDTFIDLSGDRTISFVLEALDLLHDRFYSRGGSRREPVNIQVTISAETASSSAPLLPFNTNTRSSQDTNQFPAESAHSSLLSGHREAVFPTTGKSVAPFVAFVNVTLCRTEGHRGRAGSRRDISWRELMSWRAGSTSTLENKLERQASEENINPANARTVYRVRSVVSRPVAGLTIFLSAVYRPLQRVNEEPESHSERASAPDSFVSRSRTPQKINRFWQVFDRTALSCAGALRPFKEKEPDGGEEDRNSVRKGHERIRAKQYLCISITLELDMRTQ